MNNDTRKPSFDEVVNSIRTDEPTQAEIDAAADRVRVNLGFAEPTQASPVHIESCAGFQALIPAFLEGRLPDQTALLLEDHTRECIPCRRALITARTPKSAPAVVASSGTRPAYAKWAAAAAVATVAVLGAYTAWQAVPLFGADPQLKVMRVDGALYQMNAGAMVPLRPGMKVSAKNPIRTTKDGGALVMMDDGSRVEMRDRTELTVAKRRDGATVKLTGGAIIVEASPQGSGHLDVRTDDCLVAVKGTIFSVNSGTKGSRVSVVEGAVHVAADGRESLLHPGDQMSTSNAVTPVAIGDEIAWSKDAARYGQLLNELASLRKDLTARVPTPGLRYNSRILDRMPDGTILYAAIPNLTESLVTAKQVFEEHIAQSGALQDWWNQHMSSPEHKRAMDETFENIKVLGSQLGDEIVIALTQTGDGVVHGPILMSEVKDKSEFRAALVKQMKGVEVPEASLKFDGSIVKIEFTQKLNVTDAAPVARLPRGSRQVVPPWDETPFYDKLAATYADGTSWVFGVDVKAMTTAAARQAQQHGAAAAEHLERTGVRDADTLIVERTEHADGADLRAVLTFDQPRRGVAAWLSEPAPIGAAEFISPDAAAAAAAVVQRPEALLAEALSWIGPGGIDTPGEVHSPDDADLEHLRGIAATLGGDVAVALDGPVLPIPSWKFAIEVYDAARFQSEFEALLNRINDKLASHGKDGRFVIEREDTGNRIDWVVRFTGPQAELGGGSMRYTITDGYLVAAPSRVLIDRAIEQRGNGYTLTRSAEFAALLPTDGHINVSAFVWEHLGPTIGPLAGKVSGALASDELKAVEAMAGESHPRLVTAYAESDRIVISSHGEQGIGSLLGSMVSLHSLGTLGHVLTEAQHVGTATPQ